MAMSTKQADSLSVKTIQDKALIEGLKSELSRAHSFVVNLSAAASSIQNAITLSQRHISSSRALLQLSFLTEYHPSADSHVLVSLTEREVQVLKLVAKGQTNKGIGHELGISVKTVEFHKSNATRKAGLGSRAQVVKYALGRGWLQDS